MSERVFLTIAEVLEIHNQQIQEYGGLNGIRDIGLLESAVFRPQIGYYANLAEEAAALMESLANNHPFIDGNKRVAFAATHTFILVNGYDLEIASLLAHDFIVQSIAEHQFRFHKILAWINEFMQAVD